MKEMDKMSLKLLETENDAVSKLINDIQPEELFYEKLVTRIYPEYQFKKPYSVWTGGV